MAHKRAMHFESKQIKKPEQNVQAFHYMNDMFFYLSVNSELETKSFLLNTLTT